MSRPLRIEYAGALYHITSCSAVMGSPLKWEIDSPETCTITQILKGDYTDKTFAKTASVFFIFAEFIPATKALAGTALTYQWRTKNSSQRLTRVYKIWKKRQSVSGAGRLDYRDFNEIRYCAKCIDN